MPPAAKIKKLELALRSGNTQERLAAIEDPDITADLVVLALNDKYWKVAKLAAAHPKLSEEQITKLAEDKYPPVRAKAAMNPNIPVLIAARLAKDSDHAVSNLGKIALRKQLGKSINVKEE